MKVSDIVENERSYVNPVKVKSALPSPIMLVCGMHDGGEINLLQTLHTPQDMVEQGIDIIDFGVCRQHRPQSAQATALDTHFLRVRQRYLIVQHPHRKTEVVAQMSVQFLAACMAGGRAAHHDFTFGNLYPIGTGAGYAGTQERLVKRA